jgi:hypothetical protein
MTPGLYRAMATGVLSLHAAYIAWVIFGALIHARPAAARGAARCHAGVRTDHGNLRFLVPAHGA